MGHRCPGWKHWGRVLMEGRGTGGMRGAPEPHSVPPSRVSGARFFLGFGTNVQAVPAAGALFTQHLTGRNRENPTRRAVCTWVLTRYKVNKAVSYSFLYIKEAFPPASWNIWLSLLLSAQKAAWVWSCSCWEQWIRPGLLPRSLWHCTHTHVPSCVKVLRIQSRCHRGSAAERGCCGSGSPGLKHGSTAAWIFPHPPRAQSLPHHLHSSSQAPPAHLPGHPGGGALTPTQRQALTSLLLWTQHSHRHWRGHFSIPLQHAHLASLGPQQHWAHRNDQAVPGTGGGLDSPNTWQWRQRPRPADQVLRDKDPDHHTLLTPHGRDRMRKPYGKETERTGHCPQAGGIPSPWVPRARLTRWPLPSAGASAQHHFLPHLVRPWGSPSCPSTHVHKQSVSSRPGGRRSCHLHPPSAESATPNRKEKGQGSSQVPPGP